MPGRGRTNSDRTVWDSPLNLCVWGRNATTHNRSLLLDTTRWLYFQLYNGLSLSLFPSLPTSPFTLHLYPDPQPLPSSLIMTTAFNQQVNSSHFEWLADLPQVRQEDNISDIPAQDTTHLRTLPDPGVVHNDTSSWQDGLAFNGESHHGKIPRLERYIKCRSI